MTGIYKECNLCPRECGVDRSISTGFCKSGDKLKVARAALHYWEEPCISGKYGSGTVFFSGCNLKCCFCQNYNISSDCFGKEISIERLGDIFLELQDKGANNINLVTAVQYIPSIIMALDNVKHKLNIPVVYNSGGYENISTLDILKDYVDIYLPDIKYFDMELSKRYSVAEDYFEKASKAVLKMIDNAGKLKFNDKGIMQRGVIVRHMVLPSCYKDSIKILNWIKENLPEDKFLISLMSQYTPFYKACDYPEINRRVTTYEYNKVVDEALRLGLERGYIQEKSSAKEEYTPPFDLEGV